MATLTHEVRERTRGDVETSLAILSEIFSEYHPRNFSVRLWDGTIWPHDPGVTPMFTMVLTHPGSLRAMFTHPTQLALGEAYVYNDFDIRGDIQSAFHMAEYLTHIDFTLREKVKLGALLRKLPADGHTRKGREPVRLKGALHSKERDRQAVTYHYDVSNDFFKLWLDPWMAYSCAYFSRSDESLDAAQEHKFEYICRKLDLKPGEKLLDIGCGWGGLVMYAARCYGVHATGITLSVHQSEYANQRIDQEGLQSKCSVEVLDYRDLEETEAYDKIVSVGMFEHVGEQMLPEYFERAFRLLKRGGRFLNHGIGLGFNAVTPSGPTFNDKYIFPDSEILPISKTIHAAESRGFEVRDVESLREHYELTLRHWLARLEAHHDEAVRLTDESTFRIWRLNHAGAALGFATGKNSLYQTLLVKPLNAKSNMPLTRKDWYR
jgi:cyclopropane-fatty-acyl-phospholipid synthase